MEVKFDEISKGESKARILLKSLGFQLFEIDWIGIKDGEYTAFEVKEREHYTNPDGHGMDIWKIKVRLEFEKRFGIKFYLLNFDTLDGKAYGQYLSKLEQGTFFDTKNGIRIYLLENFDIIDI